MPVLVGPAIDTTMAGTTVYVGTADRLPEPVPPPPVIGDPDVAFTPSAGTVDPRVQVLLGEAITREVFGELVTADVESWDFDVELLAGYSASITASSTDPLWSSLGLTATLGADGARKYTLKPKELVVWVYADGACVWTGRFTSPVDIGGGRVGLPAQGPQSVFAERILGRAEQQDYLADAGSIEQYRSIAEMTADGWVFPSGVTAQIVRGDGVRGSKCLRVRGSGWVQTPRVTLDGAAGYGRAVIGSTFGKWNIAIPEGAVVVRTWTQRTDASVVSNELVSFESSGVRPDDAEGWTADPVVSGARMSPEVVPHRCWVEVASFDDVWSYYDLTTLRQSIQTGFPPGTVRDLSLYVERIHRDLVSRVAGGSPTGMSTRIVEPLTGVETSQRWSHAQRTGVADVLSSVLDADGGPECRVTVGWVLEIHQRLGADRSDVALSVHDVQEPKWSSDPTAQVDDFIVDTGRGSGATWLSATVSQPFRENAWRTVAIVQGPVDRSLNETESWARTHARAAARTQVTAEVAVSWALGEQIDYGDRIWCALSDGDLGEVRQMRVLRMRWFPKVAQVSLSLGAVDA